MGQKLDDLVVDNLTVRQSIKVPALSFTDADVAGGAGVDASKLKHAIDRFYSQEKATNAAPGTFLLHVAKAAGSVQLAKFGQSVAPDTAFGSSGRTVTFDLKKNNTTILTGTVTLNSTSTAYTPVSGALATAAYVAGDRFEVVITGAGSAGTYPTGIFAQVLFYESTP
jgi:hypothetical protein